MISAVVNKETFEVENVVVAIPGVDLPPLGSFLVLVKHESMPNIGDFYVPETKTFRLSDERQKLIGDALAKLEEEAWN
jgi:hypothetical protein